MVDGVTTIMDDEWLMRQCLELAVEAKQRGDVPVASLICRTRTGEIVCRMSEQVPASSSDVTAHAELLAVREACRILNRADLSDCALVTTAEPCWMCGFAIRTARLGRVVHGQETAVYGSCTSRRHAVLCMDDADLTDGGGFGPPPIVRGGVLEEEIKALRGSEK